MLMPDYRKTTSGDIVSILLNIYDTKDVFVKELQVILADRLLASKDYGVGREVVFGFVQANEIASKYRNDQSAIRGGQHSILRRNAQRYR
jgi:hypothetical protein